MASRPVPDFHTYPRPSRLLPLMAGSLMMGALMSAWPARAQGPKPAAPLPTAQTEAKRRELQEIKSRMSEAAQHQHQLAAQASQVSSEVTALQKKLVSAAAAIQDQEVKVSAIEQQLAKLKGEKAQREAELGRRRSEISTTLAAMERLSQQPPQLVLVRPSSALDMSRSANLLGVVLPELRDQADHIRRAITSLDQLRSDMEREHQQLGQELDQLNAQHEQLNGLLAQRRDQQKELTVASATEQKRVQDYAAKAKDLSALIADLEREAARRRKAAEAARMAARKAGKTGSGASEKLASLPPLDKARGNLVLPVRGRLIRAFGDVDSTGLDSRGISIQARPNAEVVSPATGEIVFAGPFRGYGKILIIASGGGYHTLLAGLGKIDGVVGQKVVPGEPVGQMGSDSTMEGQPGSVLYVELRKEGKPINPLPWLAAGLGKVSG